jgi:hypothetical protein
MRKIIISASINSNPKYTFYLPYFIEFWLSQTQQDIEFIPRIVCINFTPRLVPAYLRYCESVFLESSLPEVTLSQLARFTFIPSESCDLIITTDIDMLPISTLPFRSAIPHISRTDSQLLVMRDVLPPGQYAICYNIASPVVWRKLLISSFSTTDFLLIIKFLENSCGSTPDWYFDQKLLYQILNSQESVEILRISDEATGLKRMDRGRHAFPLNWILLFTGFWKNYSEYHSSRPSFETKLFLNVLANRVRAEK